VTLHNLSARTIASAQSPLCWVVTDGKPGMQNQCLGLAEALGLEPVIKHVHLRAPWKQLSPHLLRLGNRMAYGADSDAIAAPWPDLLIASGRQSVAASLAVRAANPDCFRVQIQDPGIAPQGFDLVVPPRHDRCSGPNVLKTRGALHRVTAARLAADAAIWAERLGALPHPRIAVIIGGSNGVYDMTPQVVASLTNRLAALAQQTGGSLLVTASRRTGVENERVLRQGLAGFPGLIWDGQGDNPYFGFLGLADVILVTKDSVSMVSEACSTGKPVYVIELEGKSRKFDAFHQGLYDDGVTRPFAGLLESWSYPPLNDTAMAAAEVRRRSGLWG